MLYFVLDNVFRIVYRVKQMELSDLVHACSREYDLIMKIRGTDLYIVKGRDRRRGFLYVSDLSTFVYCPRKFYLMYNMSRLVDKIRLGKIRQVVRKYLQYLQDGGTVMDSESLRRVLAGQYIHMSINNAINFALLDKVEVEVEIVDLDHGLVGHVDIVEHLDDVYVNIYEIKTGLYRQVPEHYKVQALAYKYLVETVLKKKVKNVYIVYPSRDGKYLHKVREHVDVEHVLRQARRLLLEDNPPPLPEDRKRCYKCSFRTICLNIE